jgi:hypothetical protein
MHMLEGCRVLGFVQVLVVQVLEAGKCVTRPPGYPPGSSSQFVPCLVFPGYLTDGQTETPLVSWKSYRHRNFTTFCRVLTAYSHF